MLLSILVFCFQLINCFLSEINAVTEFGAVFVSDSKVWRERFWMVVSERECMGIGSAASIRWFCVTEWFLSKLDAFV